MARILGLLYVFGVLLSYGKTYLVGLKKLISDLYFDYRFAGAKDGRLMKRAISIVGTKAGIIYI